MQALRSIQGSVLGLAAALLASCGGGGGGSSAAPGPGGGGGGGGGGGEPAAAVSPDLSELLAATDFGVRADGVATVDVQVIVRDAEGEPLEGRTVELSASGEGAVVVQPTSPSDAEGRVTASLAATAAGVKTVTAVVDPGAAEVALAAEAATEFVLVPEGTFFVRTTGDDTADGQSPATAWRTIGRAAGTLEPGDTLYVGGGTYPEAVVFDGEGTPELPILVLADTKGLYTSDPGEVLVDAGGSDHAIHLDGTGSVLLRGFCVTGAMADALPGAGILVDAAVDTAVYECMAFGNEIGVAVRGGTGTVLEGNRVSNQEGPLADGIVVSDGAEVLISRNLVYNNAGRGLLVSGAGNDVVCELSTFYMNGGDQVRVVGASSAFELRESVLCDGLSAGVHFDAAASGTEHHNLVFTHPAGNYLDNEGGALSGSSVVADPLFVDPDGGDGLLGGMEGMDDLFHLDPASPALDAGSRDARTVELPLGGILSGTSSRLDGMLDGFGADGIAVNLGFHYPAPVDPFDSLAEADARVYFGRVGDIQPVHRVWQDDQLEWGQPSKIQPANATVRWIVSRVSPTIDEELVAVFTDDGADTGLYLRRWDGRAWSEANAFTPNLGGKIASADAGQRGFDLEYESTTGHALFVSSNGTDVPQFRVLANGVWTVPAPVFDAGVGGGKVLWVELVPRHGSDEIALVTLDETETLVAAVWDGSSWGAPTVLDTQVAELRDSQCFDAAFESDSGDLVVAWGYTLLIEETRYATKPAGSDLFSIAQINSADAFGTVVRLAADPASDTIVQALAEGDDGDDTIGLVWDGEAWGDIAELDNSSALDQDDLEVAWVGYTGVAVLVYRDADGAGLDWARWSSGGWKLQPDADLPGMGAWTEIALERFEAREEVMAVALDAAGDLWGLRYDGAEWLLTNGGEPLGTDVPTAGACEPFAVDFRR